MDVVITLDGDDDVLGMESETIPWLTLFPTVLSSFGLSVSLSSSSTTTKSSSKSAPGVGAVMEMTHNHV